MEEEQKELILEKKREFIRKDLVVVSEFMLTTHRRAYVDGWNKLIKDNPGLMEVYEDSIFDAHIRGTQTEHQEDQMMSFLCSVSDLLGNYQCGLKSAEEVDRFYKASTAYNGINILVKTPIYSK